MLRTRIVTAIILIPLVIGALVVGGPLFFVAIGAVLSLGAWEFSNLMGQGGHRSWLPAAVALVWVVLLDTQFPSHEVIGPGLVVVLLVSLVWAMRRFGQNDPDPVGGWALSILGGLYLGWMGSHFLRLRELGDGLWWSLTAYGSTWLADSGAYFVGRAWGRHKLAPRLSPGKTWEGSLGGVVIGTMSTALLAGFFGVGVWHGVALGVLVAVISPLGDLGISMVKRQVGAKDSSKLIPGHGGVLDKIDTLLVSVAIATYYVTWVAS
jgi:phosphatidate cytidylyltransferase